MKVRIRFSGRCSSVLLLAVSPALARRSLKRNPIRARRAIPSCSPCRKSCPPSSTSAPSTSCGARIGIRSRICGDNSSVNPAGPRPKRGQSLGSGVIVDEDGWIVTNFHVVRRADKINVVLSDGSQYEARYVSGDEKNDLALLKIDAKKPLPYVEIAGDQEPLLGETVIAIGNPFGLDHTVTKGIISAKNRRYDAGDVTFEDILQTDAAINPGNSGGPLINTRAQLVGINMAILSQAEGIGFAIPARRVANMLAMWFSPEKRARLWLGLQFKRERGQDV